LFTVVIFGMTTTSPPDVLPVSDVMDLSEPDQDVSPLSQKEIELLELHDQLHEIELEASILLSRPAPAEGKESPMGLKTDYITWF
jgi:hypothetical protein